MDSSIQRPYNRYIRWTHSFQEIEKVLGPGSEHVILERGVGSDGLYYVSYGTEDSTAIFYSPTEEGDTVVQMRFSNHSIQFAANWKN